MIGWTGEYSTPSTPTPGQFSIRHWLRTVWAYGRGLDLEDVLDENGSVIGVREVESPFKDVQERNFGQASDYIAVGMHNGFSSLLITISLFAYAYSGFSILAIPIASFAFITAQAATRFSFNKPERDYARNKKVLNKHVKPAVNKFILILGVIGTTLLSLVYAGLTTPLLLSIVALLPVVPMGINGIRFIQNSIYAVYNFIMWQRYAFKAYISVKKTLKQQVNQGITLKEQKDTEKLTPNKLYLYLDENNELKYRIRMVGALANENPLKEYTFLSMVDRESVSSIAYNEHGLTDEIRSKIDQLLVFLKQKHGNNYNAKDREKKQSLLLTQSESKLCCDNITHKILNNISLDSHEQAFIQSLILRTTNIADSEELYQEESRTVYFFLEHQIQNHRDLSHREKNFVLREAVKRGHVFDPAHEVERFRTQCIKRTLQASASLGLTVASGLILFGVVSAGTSAFLPLVLSATALNFTVTMYSTFREFYPRFFHMRFLFGDFDQRTNELNATSIGTIIKHVTNDYNENYQYSSQSSPQESSQLSRTVSTTSDDASESETDSLLSRKKSPNRSNKKDSSYIPVPNILFKKKPKKAEKTYWHLGSFVELITAIRNNSGKNKDGENITMQERQGTAILCLRHLIKDTIITLDKTDDSAQQSKREFLQGLERIILGQSCTLTDDKGKPYIINKFHSYKKDNSDIDNFERFFDKNPITARKIFGSYLRKTSNTGAVYWVAIQYVTLFIDNKSLNNNQYEINNQIKSPKSPRPESLIPHGKIEIYLNDLVEQAKEGYYDKKLPVAEPVPPPPPIIIDNPIPVPENLTDDVYLIGKVDKNTYIQTIPASSPTITDNSIFVPENFTSAPYLIGNSYNDILSETSLIIRNDANTYALRQPRPRSKTHPQEQQSNEIVIDNAIPVTKTSNLGRSKSYNDILSETSLINRGDEHTYALRQERLRFETPIEEQQSSEIDTRRSHKKEECHKSPASTARPCSSASTEEAANTGTTEPEKTSRSIYI